MTTTAAPPLTERQTKVLALVKEGKSLTQIAEAMQIKTLSGVTSHIEALIKKGYLPRGATAGKPAAKKGTKTTAKKTGAAKAKATAKVASSNGHIEEVDPSILFEADTQIAEVTTAQRDVLLKTVENVGNAIDAHVLRKEVIRNQIAALQEEDTRHDGSIGDLQGRRTALEEAASRLSV